MTQEETEDLLAKFLDSLHAKGIFLAVKGNDGELGPLNCGTIHLVERFMEELRSKETA